MKPEPMRAGDVAEEWRLQALRDLEVADQLASNRYFEWAAYAAQQAAEKAIKAVRHALAIDTHADAKLSHKLIELANPLVGAYETLLPGNADLATVTQHEADGRYPGLRMGVYQAPFKAYDQPIADKALLVARVIVERCSRLTLDLCAFWTGGPVLAPAAGTTARVLPAAGTAGLTQSAPPKPVATPKSAKALPPEPPTRPKPTRSASKSKPPKPAKP
jgi:HEPN domain-containing protein